MVRKNGSGNPLTKDQLDALRKIAHQPTQKATAPNFLIVDIIPYTGLYPDEFTHLQREWIIFPEDDGRDESAPILIKVPAEASCPPIRMNQGDIVSVNEPCSHCRYSKGEDTWSSRYESRVRFIEVMAKPARQTLRNWFESYDAIPHTVPALSHKVDRMAQKAGLDRSMKATDLRLTFGVMLARMGYNKEYIASRMGYAHKGSLPDPILRVLREPKQESTRTIWSTMELIQLLQRESKSTQEVYQELDWPKYAIRGQLKRLAELGIIDRSDEPYGEADWNVTGPQTDTLNCPVECCSASFTTLQSLSRHISTKHKATNPAGHLH